MLGIAGRAPVWPRPSRVRTWPAYPAPLLLEIKMTRRSLFACLTGLLGIPAAALLPSWLIPVRYRVGYFPPAQAGPCREKETLRVKVVITDEDESEAGMWPIEAGSAGMVMVTKPIWGDFTPDEARSMAMQLLREADRTSKVDDGQSHLEASESA